MKSPFAFSPSVLIGHAMSCVPTERITLKGIRKKTLATLANAEKAERSDVRAQVVIHFDDIRWDAQ